jgi:alcohol dehydrogenase
LREAGLEGIVYTGIDSEPTTEHVEQGFAEYLANGADGVISIGGGSCLDAGKGVAIRAHNAGPVKRLAGLDKITGVRAPHIALSTTAGTGSEVTRFAVYTDKQTGTKFLAGGDIFVPDVAIDDPELTLSSPPAVTSYAGIDALVHAIEAYVSRHAQPLTDTFALSAIRLVGGSLRRAVETGADIQARTAMLNGSLQAGMAFSNSSVALVHGMARPLGVIYPIPHGAATGILLRHVMAFSLESALSRYAEIGVALGVARPDTETRTAAERSVTAVGELCQSIGLHGLHVFGATPESLQIAIPKMVDDAMASGSPANNPRVAKADEIAALYRLAL